VTRTIAQIAALLASGTVLCSSSRADRRPTYNREVSRILLEHCVGCHHNRGVGPFPLTTYTEASAFAREIRRATQTRKMPPWAAVSGYGEFQNQRLLTVGEIKTLGEWFDKGVQEGEAGDLPAKYSADSVSKWAYGTPDLILTPRSPYSVASSGGEDVHCFAIPSGLLESKAIRAMDVQPGDPSVVYHVRAFADTTVTAHGRNAQNSGSGFDCTSSMESLFTRTLLGEWEAGFVFPPLTDGIARLLPKGADVMVEIHYHRTYKAVLDQTSVGFYFQREPVRQYVKTTSIVNHNIDIPAGESDYVATAEWTPDRDIVALAISPHMHLLGTVMRIKASFPEGQERDLVWVNEYDFYWQTSYVFRQPVRIPRGTILKVEAHYDDSHQNLNLAPDAPLRGMKWGTSLKDEMLVAFLDYVEVGAQER